MMHQLMVSQNNKIIAVNGEWETSDNESTQCITLPKNFCKITVTIKELIDKVFPNLTQNYRNFQKLSVRAMLAAKNYDVSTINITTLNEIPGNTTMYQSIDTVINQGEVVKYPTKFLDSLDKPDVLPYVLTLKFGVPIILLQNINPSRLYNFTRLIAKTLINNIIEATILNGKFKGEDVLFPRIIMIPIDMPFEFKLCSFQRDLLLQ